MCWLLVRDAIRGLGPRRLLEYTYDTRVYLLGVYRSMTNVPCTCVSFSMDVCPSKLICGVLTVQMVVEASP